MIERTRSGRVIEEEVILLRLGETLPNGKIYALTQNVRRLVREAALKPMYIEYGVPKRNESDNTKTWNERTRMSNLLRTCGTISNLRLIEDRSQPNKAVIVGTVTPSGPLTVHLRDLILGVGPTAKYVGRLFGKKEVDVSGTTIIYIESIVGWDLVTA